MTLNTLHHRFKEILKNSYPTEEISSFFYLLCESILHFDKATVALEHQFTLNTKDLQTFESALTRLKTFEPIQYIIGKTNFYGLDFFVNQDTLIPRPETEELVEWISNDFEKSDKELQLIDLGTGSGCIAISLSKALKNTKISALDFSKKALTIAKKNADLNQVNLRFYHIDLLTTTALPQTYDIMVSNPPYVKNDEKKEMLQNVLKFEPEEALFVPDNNSLLFYRKIGVLAQKHLKKGGYLYFEINQYLGQATRKLLTEELGFSEAIIKKDFLGNDRMIRVKN